MLVFDIVTMGDLLDRALIADGVPDGMIESGRVLRCAVEKYFELTDPRCVGAEALFVCFSDYCQDVGSALGFDTSEDDCCLDWAEYYPRFCDQCAQYQVVVAREMADMHRNLVPEYFARVMTIFGSQDIASLKLEPNSQRILH